MYLPASVFTKLPVCRVDQLRFCPYARCPIFTLDSREWAVSYVTAGNCDQVGRDWDRLYSIRQILIYAGNIREDTDLLVSIDNYIFSDPFAIVCRSFRRRRFTDGRKKDWEDRCDCGTVFLLQPETR